MATCFNLFVLMADEPTVGAYDENASQSFDSPSEKLTFSCLGTVDEFSLTKKEIFKKEIDDSF